MLTKFCVCFSLNCASTSNLLNLERSPPIRCVCTTARSGGFQKFLHGPFVRTRHLVNELSRLDWKISFPRNGLAERFPTSFHFSAKANNHATSAIIVRRKRIDSRTLSRYVFSVTGYVIQKRFVRYFQAARSQIVRARSSNNGVRIAMLNRGRSLRSMRYFGRGELRYNWKRISQNVYGSLSVIYRSSWLLTLSSPFLNLQLRIFRRV